MASSSSIGIACLELSGKEVEKLLENLVKHWSMARRKAAEPRYIIGIDYSFAHPGPYKKVYLGDWR